MSEGDVQIMVAPPSDGTLTFCNRRGWVVKVTAEGRLGFNREAFPELDADGFAKEFVEVLENWVPGMSAKAQRWIPVSERLPEPEVWVLVYDPNKRRRPVQDAYLQWSEPQDDAEWIAGLKPTHWMPLPEPPK